MSTAPTLVWFRHDLRLQDHPSLRAATRRGGPVLPVFIWAPQEEGKWAPGAASRWWLHQSLAQLQKDLEKCRSRLILRKGGSEAELQRLIRETNAGAVYWNRRYERTVEKRDEKIKQSLEKIGLEVKSFNASLLFEPWTLATKQGQPYRVFTPFWNACRRQGEPPQPEAALTRLPSPSAWPPSLDLAELALEPEIDWAAGLRRAWSPGSRGARRELDRFLEESLQTYPVARDRPDRVGTSRLSPHLHFGEIGPRQVWHSVQEQVDHQSRRGAVSASEAYLRQLVWREFAYHLVYHFPHTPLRPLREEFAKFPWQRGAAGLEAWQKGETGYPIVDAGMRQLWETGWMHNRVRMLAASFLIKDLLRPWQEGARWFWDTLVDADLANNTMGWQWCAGCGADAAPYFRIFNPVTQGQKFDPHGEYVRRFVPELRKLPDEWIHRPWSAPSEVLRAAQVKLGNNYPPPLVEHSEARGRALAAYARIRSRR